jgi:hypothetical protein
MWGFNSAIDRPLANKIFNRVLDKNLAESYVINSESRKGEDQMFLSEHVFEDIASKSAVHDSYLCQRYRSSPWPTRRTGNCFVGNPYPCNETASDFNECPVKCRPKEHQDWKYC